MAARSQPPANSVDQHIAAALADGSKTRPFSKLRATCRVRTTTLDERLTVMTTAGRIAKSTEGYRLAAP